MQTSNPASPNLEGPTLLSRLLSGDSGNAFEQIRKILINPAPQILQPAPKGTITNAQAIYNRLLKDDISGFASPLSAVDAINEILDQHNVTSSALDPEGKKLSVDIDMEMNNAVIRYETNRARALFEDIQNGKIEPVGTLDYTAKDISEILKAVNKDLSALDKSGQKTAAQIESTLVDYIKSDHLQHARKLFNELCKGELNSVGSIFEAVEKIRSLLEKAGKDSSALDPTGKADKEKKDGFHESLSAPSPTDKEVRHEFYKPANLPIAQASPAADKSRQV